MIIHILCNDGSPLGVTHKDIFGESGRIGVGGAELAMLTMCEAWTKAGHEVVLFNDPRRPNESPFEQRAIDDFQEGAKRDVLIIFRSPNQKIMRADCFRVWWSCDQQTVGDFKHFSTLVQKVVTISPFHTEYFKAKYDIQNSIPIDIPVRVWEYDQAIEKVPNRIIFTSVPDRGLEFVHKTFPRIRAAISDASLVVTSDYRLWGATSPMNDRYVRDFMLMEGVQFLGGVTRSRLIEEQLKGQIHLYPAVYEELFCIAVAESQVAGVLPITTPTGALSTTNMGVLIDGYARDQRTQDVFVEKTIEYLMKPDLPEIQAELQALARNRFSVERALRLWDEQVFNGG